MGTIKIDAEEIEEIKSRFDNLSSRREQQIGTLKDIVERLNEAKTCGFIEEIVDKLDDHIIDVSNNQIGNIEYTSDFLRLLIENFTDLDQDSKL